LSQQLNYLLLASCQLARGSGCSLVLRLQVKKVRRDQRRNITLVLEDGPDGNWQLSGGSRLWQITRSAAPKRFGGHSRISIHGQKDDLDRFLYELELLGSVQAVKQRHANVHEHDIGIQPAGGIDEGLAVAY